VTAFTNPGEHVESPARPARAPLRLRYFGSDGGQRFVTVDRADEVAFEDCPPVRRIPHYRGSAHTPGEYWSATTGDLIAYESFLESKWMILLDFDPDIVAFCGQPFTFDGVDIEGAFIHTPDLFARRADGGGLLLDVKNPNEISKPDVVRQARRTAAVCERIGWQYRMVGEPDRQPMANIAWLAGFRRPLHAGAELIPALLGLAAQPVSLAELLRFQPVPELARPVVFHLLWHHRLTFDLQQPLRETTVLHTAPRRSPR
jgi:hypothetical protein